MGTHESEIIDEIIVSMQRTPLKKTVGHRE